MESLVLSFLTTYLILFQTEIKDIISSGENAALYLGKLAQVFKCAEYLVENKVKYEVDIVYDLHKQTSTKTMLTKLEQIQEYYWCQTVLPKLKAEKLQSQSPEEIIAAIGKEQEFLASLYGHSRNTDFDKDVLEKARKAHAYHEEKALDRLHKITKEVISRGAKDTKAISDLLKETDDIGKLTSSLEVALEAHNINQKLGAISKEKAASKTPEEALKAIEQNQEFLVSLHSHLKYQGHESKLLLQIEQAYEQKQGDILSDLHKLVSHVTEHEVMTKDQLTKYLQSNNNPEVIRRDLTASCQDHHMNIVTKNIETLINHEPVEVGKQKFECPIKYLEHEIAHPAHQYVDRARLTMALPALEQQIQRQFSRSMDGPDF